jgi:hypothetical protein
MRASLAKRRMHQRSATKPTVPKNPRTAPSALRRMSALAMLHAAACSNNPDVQPARTCADPCCNGQAGSVDCAETPDVSCTEDASPCVARSYGCVKGVYYVYKPLPPPGCSSSLLGDAIAFSPNETPDAEAQDDADDSP